MTRFFLGPRTLALLLSGSVTLAPAWAQSGYSLTVLKPPGTVKLVERSGFHLDDQNRVLGQADVQTGYNYLPRWFPMIGWVAPGPIYGRSLVRWPASTAASVSPVKLIDVNLGPEVMEAVSPDGKTLVRHGVVYNMESLAVAALSGQLSFPDKTYYVSGLESARGGINNRGHIAVTHMAADPSAYLWTVGQTQLVRLPSQGDSQARAVAINATGTTVAGHVVDPTSGVPRAALWMDRTLQVIDPLPARSSSAIGINQMGHVLLQVQAVTLTTYPGDPPVVVASFGKRSGAVWFNGQESTVAPLKSGDAVVPYDIHASGAVVGRSGRSIPDLAGLSSADARPGRAFLWKNGVTLDLTNLVTSKGVVLPTGSVLTTALDINDQGSILAIMTSTSGSDSLVRLTARP